MVRRAGLAEDARPQPDGRHRPRHGHRHPPRRVRRQARGGHRPRLPPVFLVDQDGADLRHDGGGLQGARHRPGADADGLFRPVRPRRPGGRDGDRIAQRERLDRRQDGLAPPGHLRAGGDRPAQGDRACRRLRPEGRRRIRLRGELRRPLHGRPHQPAEAQEQDQGGRRLRQRHRRPVRAEGARRARRRGDPARRRARLHVPALQSQPRRPRDAARHGEGGARQQGGCRPRLRRRRRPLRRDRQHRRGDLRRQGRRDAGARSFHPSSRFDLRRRRQVDRPVHDRSGLDARTRSRPTTGRQVTPTSSAGSTS